jgi:hypothetical protein
MLLERFRAAFNNIDASIRGRTGLQIGQGDFSHVLHAFNRAASFSQSDYRFLLSIAKFWKPNLNDGLQITVAPLWEHFRHNPWQKVLKDTWKKLEHGDYDWAHLAHSIWLQQMTVPRAALSTIREEIR